MVNVLRGDQMGEQCSSSGLTQKAKSWKSIETSHVLSVFGVKLELRNLILAISWI